MLATNPVINFESATLRSKLTHEINNCLTVNMLVEMEQSPFTYSLAYEQFLKNLYLTIMHSMICDANLVINRIKFATVDIPLLEPITLVEDESGQLLHVLSRTLMQRIFHHKGNFKLIVSKNNAPKALAITETNSENRNESESNNTNSSLTMMLKLKNIHNNPEFNDEAIHLSPAVQDKLLLCYVVAEHAVMHYCQYINKRIDPDYQHKYLDELASKNSKHIFLSQLITTKEDRKIYKYLE